MLGPVLTLMERFAPVTLAVGLGLLVLGGKYLVDGAVGIARRLEIPTLVIGLTVVAFGTSAPELAFNAIAALNNRGDLSFGNVIGSNIANLGLVLGAAALIMPITMAPPVVKRDLPIVIGVTILGVVLAFTPPDLPETAVSSRGYDGLDGLIFLAGFVWFLWVAQRAARRGEDDPIAREMVEVGQTEPSLGLTASIVAFVGGLAMLVAGGKAAEVGAVGLAGLLGMSEAIIGLTVVAVATSLPELVTSLIAAKKGEPDLALGNVLGSNIFNLLFIMGVTAAINPVGMPVPGGAWDLGMMLVLTFAVFLFSLGKAKRIARFEGTALLFGYAAYIAFAVLRERGVIG